MIVLLGGWSLFLYSRLQADEPASGAGLLQMEGSEAGVRQRLVLLERALREEAEKLEETGEAVDELQRERRDVGVDDSSSSRGHGANAAEQVEADGSARSTREPRHSSADSTDDHAGSRARRSSWASELAAQARRSAEQRRAEEAAAADKEAVKGKQDPEEPAKGKQDSDDDPSDPLPLLRRRMRRERSKDWSAEAARRRRDLAKNRVPLRPARPLPPAAH